MICGWIPPTSNSAPLLRMHVGCEWSIINRIGNELWMCNISCNRQLNMDREKIATIAPQIVYVQHTDVKDHHQTMRRLSTWRVEVQRERGWWEDWESNIQIGEYYCLSRHLWQVKNVIWIVWVNKQTLILFSSVSLLLAFKLLGAGEHRLWWVTHALSFSVFRQTSELSRMPSAVSLKHNSHCSSVVDTLWVLIQRAIPCNVSGPRGAPTTQSPAG